MIARLSQATSAALVLLLNWWILFFTHTKRNRCHCPKFTKHQTNCDFESVYQAWDFQVASLYPRTRLREPVAAHSNCHWFRNALCLLLPVQRTHTRHWAANSLRETTGVMVRRQKGLKLELYRLTDEMWWIFRLQNHKKTEWSLNLNFLDPVKTTKLSQA